METVIEVNDARKRAMADKILEAMSDSVAGKRIAVLGVTFKPNTDDMRAAPSLTSVPALIGKGAEVFVSDPEGKKEGEHLLPGVNWCDDAYSAVDGADGVVIITEWNEFRGLDLKRLLGKMKGNVMVDLRNIYSPQEAKSAGFSYVSIGR